MTAEGEDSIIVSPRVGVRSELTFSTVWELPWALSLCFPMFWGPPTLSLHICAAKSPRGQFSVTPGGGNFGGFGPRAGTFEEGTRTFIADT